MTLSLFKSHSETGLCLPWANPVIGAELSRERFSLLELSGGSVDTDCCDGEEYCEEVFREYHRRCRIAK